MKYVFLYHTNTLFSLVKHTLKLLPKSARIRKVLQNTKTQILRMFKIILTRGHSGLWVINSYLIHRNIVLEELFYIEPDWSPSSPFLGLFKLFCQPKRSKNIPTKTISSNF